MKIKRFIATVVCGALLVAGSGMPHPTVNAEDVEEAVITSEEVAEEPSEEATEEPVDEKDDIKDTDAADVETLTEESVETIEVETVIVNDKNVKDTTVSETIDENANELQVDKKQDDIIDEDTTLNKAESDINIKNKDIADNITKLIDYIKAHNEAINNDEEDIWYPDDMYYTGHAAPGNNEVSFQYEGQEDLLIYYTDVQVGDNIYYAVGCAYSLDSDSAYIYVSGHSKDWDGSYYANAESNNFDLHSYKKDDIISFSSDSEDDGFDDNLLNKAIITAFERFDKRVNEIIGVNLSDLGFYKYNSSDSVSIPVSSENAVENTTKASENYTGAALANSATELKNLVLTTDEQKLLSDGIDIRVWLDVNNISANVTEADKKTISDKLPGNYKVGSYLDINLYKQIGDNDASKIANVPNGNVKIQITVPPELQKEGRTFKIIRLHEGVATVIDTIQSENSLTFETNQFSTYALVYSDVTTNNVVSPKTGDNIPIVFMIILMISSLTIILRLKKKNA